MIDITREEIWENNSEEVGRANKEKRFRNFIARHKVITAMLIVFAVLTSINTVLIYNFLRILSNM